MGGFLRYSGESAFFSQPQTTSTGRPQVAPPLPLLFLSANKGGIRCLFDIKKGLTSSSPPLQIPQFIAVILLCIWKIPRGVKFMCYYLSGLGGATSPILYSWVNISTSLSSNPCPSGTRPPGVPSRVSQIANHPPLPSSAMRKDPEQRALILSSMMTAGFASNLFIPLLAYPTKEAPRYPKGYPTSIAFNILYFIVWGAGFYLYRNSNTQVGNDDDAVSEGESADAKSIEEKSIGEVTAEKSIGEAAPVAVLEKQ